MTPPVALSAALRAHARGLYYLEAATELLIDHRTWLHRDDFTVFITTHPGLLTHAEPAHLNWQAAITALDTGELPCSGGEGRMLRLAASLAEGIPVDLRDALTGIDTNNITLMTKAVLHTSGHRQTPHSR